VEKEPGLGGYREIGKGKHEIWPWRKIIFNYFWLAPFFKLFFTLKMLTKSSGWCIIKVEVRFLKIRNSGFSQGDTVNEV
jgi:hypothetical protein